VSFVFVKRCVFEIAIEIVMKYIEVGIIIYELVLLFVSIMFL